MLGSGGDSCTQTFEHRKGADVLDHTILCGIEQLNSLKGKVFSTMQEWKCLWQAQRPLLRPGRDVYAPPRKNRRMAADMQ
jgi:hypothetical protein